MVEWLQHKYDQFHDVHDELHDARAKYDAMESELMLVIQTIVEKKNKFIDEDITRYLEVYEFEMIAKV